MGMREVVYDAIAGGDGVRREQRIRMKSLTRKYAAPTATVHGVALSLDQNLPLDAARSPLGSLNPICSGHFHAFHRRTACDTKPWRSTLTAEKAE